ncbi:hypothetical protein K1719_017045 [Acacia pycnantha]|nr:hypothetical protein K1719_017045 [Acacia pycnantha]
MMAPPSFPGEHSYELSSSSTNIFILIMLVIIISLIMFNFSDSSANHSPTVTPRGVTPTGHDVFISFRGVDTRTGFVSHLRAAFKRKGIKTYMDYDLERGNEISPTLLVAIKQSKILIIVFSENYAGSRWTLDELAKIMECRRTKGQHVIPIFIEYIQAMCDIKRAIMKLPSNYIRSSLRLTTALCNSGGQPWQKHLISLVGISHVLETRWNWTKSSKICLHLMALFFVYRDEDEHVEEIANNVMRKLESMSQSPVIVGDIQIETEPQSVNFASKNHSDDLNSGDSHDLNSGDSHDLNSSDSHDHPPGVLPQ